MPTYTYECATHGRMDVRQQMRDAHIPHTCPACLGEWQAGRGPGGIPDLPAALDAFTMRRVYTAPAVQNHSKGEGGLTSWGRDERWGRISKAQWLAEKRRERREYGPQED